MQDLFDRSLGCCFTGHRPDALPDHGNEKKPAMLVLRAFLDIAIQEAICDGITEFYAGGALGFDMIAAETVLCLRESDPRISLRLALPGYDQTSGWNTEQIARYNAILNKAASLWYASERCSPGSMQRRNRFLVDHTCRCIAYLRRMRGGTFYTVNYALDQEIKVLNLAEHM
ncbi:MAG: SLOG family protein [Eubacteriales bacterium]|nr:SLOG family protein [Eubacteriales bacterium]